ncbi:MAG TPA: hypothetical protein VFI86_08395, partial [Burkholderiales bacterium]|nr:hypothetical protein [Burkholderiales bacterium]
MKIRALAAPFLAAALLAGGCSKAVEAPPARQGQAVSGQSAPSAIANAHAQSAPQPVAGAAFPDFSAIVEANKGAVVNITSTINAGAAAAGRSAAPRSPDGQGGPGPGGQGGLGGDDD